MELLIALAITAGLGALSMPLFKQQTESLLLQQASSRWLSYLHQVKAKAQRAEDNIMADLAPLEGRSNVFELATESTYSSTSPLVFYGVSGGAAPGHIRIMNNSSTVKVIISSKGRVRSCVSHGPALPGLSLC
ncbi:MAG: prepilin peptidase dependent protein A-like protein [Idiomarina sp.]|nr:prepilin peptidase dependent protein A-like protein [Idiomarina sp.]